MRYGRVRVGGVLFVGMWCIVVEVRSGRLVRILENFWSNCLMSLRCDGVKVGLI